MGCRQHVDGCEEEDDGQRVGSRFGWLRSIGNGLEANLVLGVAFGGCWTMARLWVLVMEGGDGGLGLVGFK